MYVALMAGSLILGKIWFALVCAILMVLGILELAKITGRDMSRRTSIIVTVEDIIGGLLLSLGLQFGDILAYTVCAFFGLFLIRCITELYTKSENPLKELATSVFMQIYLGLGFYSMLYMAVEPILVLLILVVIWSNDTGAYLVGCLIGKHRMFERISPKKTWEGFFGGLVIACGMALLFAWLFMKSSIFNGLEYVSILLLSVIVVVFGTWGDLIESLIKRSVHIKDSGNLIPGHGGILDRIDSLLLAMPAALIYCTFSRIYELF